MDLDLTEYDQVDEIKLIIDHQNQMYGDGAAGKFLVTLSSCSDQASLEEANYENDFVFLPGPPNNSNIYPNQYQATTTATTSRSQNHLLPRIELRPTTKPDEPQPVLEPIQQVPASLIAITNTGNPFENCKPEELRQSCNIMRRLEACISKPTGLIEANPAVLNNDPAKLTELMQQIVTRSDSIYIAVPCAYCHEPITCPPSDISSWLNHMNRQHNCKICPVCDKFVGLGPRRDLEIMKSHVIEHFDEEWLDRRPMKINFSHGLQQHWFSGTRCGIEDKRNK